MQGSYVFVAVSNSFSVSQQDHAKKTAGPIVTDFGGKVAHGTRKKQAVGGRPPKYAPPRT